jgi:hypothetical protein
VWSGPGSAGLPGHISILTEAINGEFNVDIGSYRNPTR